MTAKFSKRAEAAEASEIRELLKLTERADVISFGGGLPGPEAFPVEEFTKVCLEIFQEYGTNVLQYGTTEGFGPLRKIITERMALSNVKIPSENILITNGSQQGLDLTGKVFIDDGDTIICEEPTYLAAINAFKAYAPKFVDVSMDEQGMIMEELENALINHPEAKFIYTIPNFQNPTGKTMNIERRKRMVEIANRYDVTIIEDNPYGELCFDGEKLLPIKAFDTEDRVVYLGTFSKILSPGLRIGWVCASDEIIQKYVRLKQGTDLHTNMLSQVLIAKFMEKYDLNAQIEKIKRIYKRKRDIMLDTMKQEFPEAVKFTYSNGGLFTWVELPEHMNSREILKAALLEEKVAFVPGGSFYANNPKENTMRINFSNASEEMIVEGIRRLAKVIRKYMNATSNQKA